MESDKITRLYLMLHERNMCIDIKFEKSSFAFNVKVFIHPPTTIINIKLVLHIQLL